MRIRSFIVVLVCLSVAAVYLFITAPPPLMSEKRGERPIPIETALIIINNENNAARALYAKEIVGAGKKVGFKFSEHWRKPDVIAGPLPALFLRETARHLEKLPLPLGLFLGSDQPINTANRFSGRQIEAFDEIKRTRKPSFFFAPNLQRNIAMFPDLAKVEPCIECHNDHPDSPKDDWKLNDVMGAVTWSHPESFLSATELLESVRALRESIDFAYGRVITALSRLEDPPQIGDCWPREGRCLPSREVFAKELERRASAQTLQQLLAIKEARDDNQRDNLN